MVRAEAAGILEAIARLTARERLLRASLLAEGSMSDRSDLTAALLAARRVLLDAGVPHALIGGLAVGIHSGLPRATDDVDIAVVSTADRAELARTFRDAGFRVTGSFAHSLNLRHATGQPVQLAFDPGFDEAIARAESFPLRGDPVPVVSRDDLIRMKERAASDPARRKSKRLRDLADVELLRGDVPDPDEGW